MMGDMPNSRKFCLSVVFIKKKDRKIIVTLLEVLEKASHKKLLQTAWNYMTDSLRSELFVCYDPETIACACIFLSARILQIPLPNKPAWYLIFDVCEEDLTRVSDIILGLYIMKKPDPDKLDKIVDEVKTAHEEAKQRAKKGLSLINAIMANHHSFSPSSTPSSPKGKSPSADTKKEKDDTKTNNGILPKDTNHRKRRSVTPIDDASPRLKKKSKTSPSTSLSSRSGSPHHKHGKTPPRGFKESRRSRSRSHSKTRDLKKNRRHGGHKSHKRSHSNSISPIPRKHSSNSSAKKTYKSKSSKSRHSSKSPSRNRDHNHHHPHSNSHEKTHKSHKDKNVRHNKEKSRR